jgi:sugar phosphate isomerase/epimerase
MYSRRKFGQLLGMSLPCALSLTGMDSTAEAADSSPATNRSMVKGVRLGLITYSFSDMPNVVGQDHIDMVIQNCQACGVGLIELMSNHAEPVTDYQMKQAAARAARIAAAAANPNGASGRATASPGGGGGAENRGTPTPEALRARDELREWRLLTPMSHFQDIKKKFDDAGIVVYAYCVNGMGADFTDQEIDKMFAQAQTLGATVISTSTTLEVAQKLVPIVEKHQFPVSFHNHSNLVDPNQFATPESFAKALAMSKFYKINLDIGHFTQANFDAVSYLQQHHADISHLHVKDVKRDGGPILPWGQADTPIKAVLQLLETNQWPIPAEVELEYRIPAGSNSVEEVKKCMAIMMADLA